MKQDWTQNDEWFATERGGGSCFSVAKQVETKRGHRTTHYICHVADGIQDAKEIASLLAAAPGMYEYLRYAVECVSCGCMPNSVWLENAILQIDKARGERG